MEETTQKATPMMHSFREEDQGVSVGKALLILLFSAVLGVSSGWALVSVMQGGETKSSPANESDVSAGQTYGSSDTDAFPDKAEGTIEKGGIDGEGQYHLVRTGGESQNVYLTSSAVDLSLFVGRKVKIWGETQEGQKAGWLMDVGRVEVL
jgi:hypothetical protein